MDTTAQVEKKLVDALGVLSDRNMEVARLDLALKDKDEEVASLKERLDLEAVTLSNALRAISVRDIEIERLTFALKDKDEELAKECRKRSELQSDVIFKNQELKSFEDRIAELVRTLSCRDIEIERLTFALKDKDNELESVRDEHRTQIDELMEEIVRLTRKNKKPFKVAELQDLVNKQQQSIDNLWLYVQSIAAHINTGGTPDEPEQM